MRHAVATALLAGFLWAPGAQAADTCEPGSVDVRSDRSTVRFSVEIADEEPERALGLMNRQELGRFASMLFIYERPIEAVFWMKNTLIPLDMIFADPTGTVTRVIANAEPLSLEHRRGGDNVQYVLEINGGLAERLGIGEGAVLRHPQMDQAQAAWPCPEAGADAQ
ncbi:DUF192 domain-containing protein [Oceanomicrobium pacificus]|uniref:DUF192 domain-containing protein n=1 Tax=Oceanomicrobium pacificus TaxID=2692916 RepID=A0A6B0TNI8_9RHOB|nr:DUF192 domain-containing protein [Oceanomicrobium pacificus]MXU66170.1 DUF192 domain-containing protein [Oceanomicrobium pacificus]